MFTLCYLCFIVWFVFWRLFELPTLLFMFCASHFVVWTLHSTFRTLPFVVCLLFVCYSSLPPCYLFPTLLFVFHINILLKHFILWTHALFFAFHILLFTLQVFFFVICSLQFFLWTLHFGLCDLFFELCVFVFTICFSWFVFWTLCFGLCNLFFTLRALLKHFIVHVPSPYYIQVCIIAIYYYYYYYFLVSICLCIFLMLWVFGLLLSL